ncbi:methyltransferase domain-containing protein [Amycolatopsis oliviviridis]|uniref:tRNA 5-carboxymethoxyuridine methyltransferase n=1 Tax=Amycolatopsis oliviviridis TaxID=1471590 RepID=A0ABQ3LC98_9PSEU|nr:class I SAM-dependent methyltransferase [Amycolatopsis oliviviridis]GHH11302.1 tRNA 5-carboxymethoxyuridine methyltransferase [Amycolatopsis oliviviridis]
MLTESYRYPDTGDHVTGMFIRRHEPYDGYWTASEDRALGKVAEQLTAPLGRREEVKALDAGCGEGRLLPWVARFSADVTAADPDPDRLAKARETVIEDTKLSFAVSPITELDGGPYDLVVCSHVVQHVPTPDVAPILRRLAEVTAPGGALVLAHSRSPIGRGAFSLDSVEAGGVVRSRRVSREEFDKALREGSGPALPVRYLDPAEIAAEAAEAGWRTEWEWTYHVLDDLGPADEHIDRDELVNASGPLRRHLGRDLITLLRRAPA